MPSPAFLEYGPPLLSGAVVTIKLTLLSEVVALLVGFIVGPTLLSRWSPLRVLCRCYVELFRGTSALIQLFFLYFVLPQLGVDLPPVTVADLGLGLNSGAYCAEFVRGAILAVPRGQREAAAALGLSRRDQFRFVVLPQAAFHAIPPLGNMSIDLLKLTSIVSFITIADMTFVAYQINQTTLDTIPLFSMVLAFYFVVAQAIAFAFRRAESRLGRGMRRMRALP